MKEKKRKVPKLRFPGFTDDWEQRELGEVVVEVTRNNGDSAAPIMMITANDGFINQSNRYSTNNAGQSLKKYILLKKGELAYNHGASKLRPYGSCFALTTVKEVRIPFVYHCFATKTENPEFLAFILNGNTVERQLRKIVSSGARMDGLLNISFKDYVLIPIMLPKREEQDVIVDYFNHIDNLITLHQRKLEHLQLKKKALLQKLFPKKGEKYPELRFPGFTESWEKYKLIDIATTFIGLVTTMTKNYKDKGILLIRNSDIRDNQFKFSDKPIYLDEEFAEKNKSRKLKIGDVVTVHTGDIGTSSVVTKKEEGAIGFATINTRVDAKILNPQFLATYFNTIQHKKYAIRMSTGDGRLNYNMKDFNKLELIVPNLAEQVKIANLIKIMNQNISLQQRKIEHLQLQKKALLQQMFV
ncbi:MAG: restriction endonuclease subunit S [Veillonellaceae bacterium]|nr:restriction endonuclease subunit S [Veillonellaceae bacterium]